MSDNHIVTCQEGDADVEGSVGLQPGSCPMCPELRPRWGSADYPKLSGFPTILLEEFVVLHEV